MSVDRLLPIVPLISPLTSYLCFPFSLSLLYPPSLSPLLLPLPLIPTTRYLPLNEICLLFLSQSSWPDLQWFCPANTVANLLSLSPLALSLLPLYTGFCPRIPSVAFSLASAFSFSWQSMHIYLSCSLPLFHFLTLSFSFYIYISLFLLHLSFSPSPSVFLSLPGSYSLASSPTLFTYLPIPLIVLQSLSNHLKYFSARQIISRLSSDLSFIWLNISLPLFSHPTPISLN